VAAGWILGDRFLAAAYAGVALILLGVGAGLARLEAPEDLRANEALVVPTLSFLAAPFLFAIPPTLAGVDPLDALFESVSGFTTTGLSTLGSSEAQPRTLLFVRAWQQWMGGLGVVVFALAVFVGPGIAARRLAEESLGEAEILRSTRSRARSVLSIYLVLTSLGVAGLWALGLGPFDAITHALAAVSTGGFSTRDASLAAFPGELQRVAVIALSALCAISFSLYRPRPGWSVRSFTSDLGVRTLLGLGLAVSLLLIGIEALNQPTGASEWLRELPLLAFSAQSTAGFSSVPVADLQPASKLVLVGAMLVGGDMGSTAGGFKLLRLLILVRVVQMAIRRRSLPPHAVVASTIRGHRLEDAEIASALSTVLLFLGVVGVGWLVFVAFGHPAVDSLFEIASATGTVGLSTGLSRPELEAPLKAILCIAMWMGRLEVLPLLVALGPATWRRPEEEAS
jgi:trk system potassium uptake protein TrkH